MVDETRIYADTVDGLRRAGWSRIDAEGEALRRQERRRFLNQRLGAGWTIARKTPANLAAYGNCVSRKEYDAAVAEFERMNP